MTMPVRQAISADEARRFDTGALRRNFLIDRVFVPGEISLTYSHLDRTIAGGAMPVGDEMILATEKQVG